MPDGRIITYRYDGSFEGFLCCVFESYAKKEMPDDIAGPGDVQTTLFDEKEIPTDGGKAKRVADSIPQKMGAEAFFCLKQAYLTCLPEKELHMLRFVRLGFERGRAVMHMLQHDVVNTLFRAVQHLGGEAHLLKGFIRFSDYGGVLATQITPKNFVLPLLAPHFAARYPQESFLIYDKTHGTVLAHEWGKRMEIRAVEGFETPEADEDERAFRRLWKLFYDTIAVEGRENSKCRMTQMPKRYWENMTEFADDTQEKMKITL